MDGVLLKAEADCASSVCRSWDAEQPLKNRGIQQLTQIPGPGFVASIGLDSICCACACVIVIPERLDCLVHFAWDVFLLGFWIGTL